MMVISFFKKIIKNIFDVFGYEISRKKVFSNEIGFNPNYLSRICNPQIVFDIGVGHGTNSLYEAFPEAHFILIEPVIEFEDSIKKIKDKYSCEVYYNAVGESFSNVEINVDKLKLTKSSFGKRTKLTETGSMIEKRKVEVITLDTFFEQMSKKNGPILLKIDAEGNELSILRGSTKLLKLIDVAILEVSIAKRFHDSYEFEDILFFMREHNFYLYSILETISINGELRPRFSDLVFKKRS